VTETSSAPIIPATKEALPRASVISLAVLPIAAFLVAAAFVAWHPSVETTIALPLPFLSPQIQILAGLVFWVGLTAFAAFNTINLSGKTGWSTSLAPQIAATFLGGPIAGMIAVLGSVDPQEWRGKVHWYMVLGNLANGVLAVCAASVPFLVAGTQSSPLIKFGLMLIGAAAYITVNNLILATILALRYTRPLRRMLSANLVGIGAMYLALAPTTWLMTFLYSAAGPWAVLLTALPLFSIKVAVSRFAQMRESFISTIRSLSNAVEARDRFTSGHSTRVSEIAVDIGRAMGLSDSDVERLEWAGILHDIGKIGVPDAVLMKPGRLTNEEYGIIQQHPVIGHNIVRPIKMLTSELPIILYHHERFDGKGYPDGIAGEDIPLLARVMSVADSFDAMTSQRPYRMVPLTVQETMDEIRRMAGTQFDPVVVAAFEKTVWAQGAEDPRRFVGEEFNQAELSSAAARIAAGYAVVFGPEAGEAAPIPHSKRVDSAA